MSCVIVGNDCKLPGEKLPIQIDLTKFCENLWNSRCGAGIYALGEVVRPTEANRTGYEYIVTQAGQTLIDEPSWPTTIGATVMDGSVEWTCQAISNDSLQKTITSVIWDGDGFTVTDTFIVNTDGEQRIGCMISGDQPPKKYLVVADVTFSDTHSEKFGVEIKMSR